MSKRGFFSEVPLWSFLCPLVHFDCEIDAILPGDASTPGPCGDRDGVDSARDQESDKGNRSAGWAHPALGLDSGSG